MNRLSGPAPSDIQPFMFASPDDFTARLADLPEARADWTAAALARQAELTKPPGSLGRLEEIAVFLAGWGRDDRPRAANGLVAVFAGSHGVVRQGVSPYPPDVTAQMVGNFEAGGAAINAITGSVGLGLEVVPLRVDVPTADFTEGPALGEAELLEALNAGAAVVADDLDVLVLGEMGIGNTTVAAALCARSLGGAGADWAGPGTGLDGPGVSRKAAVIDRGIAVHRDAPHGAAETLRRVGGRETAAIAGAILAARQRRIPVVLDGFVVGASLAPLFAENPGIVDHCLAGHCSAEPGHRRLLDRIGLQPILDLSMRLGEGTGAALAVSMLRAAAAAHVGMATFAEAAVSNRPD